MAANTNPIFALTPNNGAFNVVLTTGANNYDGTNAAAALIYTAGANGSFLQKLICKGIGTSNANTVVRLFLNNGSGSVGTATNNIFFAEFSLPATTGSASAAVQPYEFVINKILGAGAKIYALLGTTVSGGYAVSADGGDF
jgi:hypothetical protein